MWCSRSIAEISSGDSPTDGDRSAYKRAVDNSAKRSWDVAPLLLAGVLVGLLGPLLAGTGSAWSALLSLGGMVLLVTALVRWTRRARERATHVDVAPDAMSGAV